MLGLVMRGMFGGGGGMLGMLLGGLIAFCAVWGLCKLAACRMRNCSCIKRCLRCTGTDEFDDFEVMVLVHDVTFAHSSHVNAAIRVKAGDQGAETDVNDKGVFQQPLSILVEQGTEHLEVDLIDGHTVLATLKLDIMKDVLNPQDKVMEKAFPMKQQSKSVVNPKVKLSIHLNEDEEDERLISNLHVSGETDVMLRQQLQKVTKEKGGADGMSELELLAQGCAGPVETFGSWGAHHSKYITIVGPPTEKKYKLCVWDSEVQSQKEKTAPNTEIPVLRIQAVQPDPGRSEVFCITYLDDRKMRNRLVLRRVDRSRDVWTEMLTMLVEMAHAAKHAKKCDSALDLEDGRRGSTRGESSHKSKKKTRNFD